jgi:hypothetical protein
MADYEDNFQRYVAIEERVYAVAGVSVAGNDYICNEDGYIYEISGYGDLTNPISSYWQSKELDFKEKYPELKGRFKAIDRIEITYKDTDTDIPMTVFISNDHGVTWESKTKLVGTDSGKVKVATFWMAGITSSHGRAFSMRFECSSATVDFEIHGIKIWFYPLGEYFPVS